MDGEPARYAHSYSAAAAYRKASRGNLGDVKPVGGDVFEMREFFGPGWRMYYVKQGPRSS